MRIEKVQGNQYIQYNRNNKVSNNFTCPNTPVVQNLNLLPASYPLINFKGADNADGLKKLYSMDIPCVYCGRLLIEEDFINNLSKKGILAGPCKDFAESISPIKDRLHPIERQAFDMIETMSMEFPDEDLNGIFGMVKNTYEVILRNEQRPIFDMLYELSDDLDADSSEKFQKLMVLTQKRVSNKPVIIPFSRKEFAFKFDKLTETMEDRRALQKMKNHMKALPNEKTSKLPAQELLKRQLESLEKIKMTINRKAFPEKSELMELLNSSICRVNGKPSIISFNRKAFIYDLNEAIENNPDKDFNKFMIDTARHLPSSEKSISAFVMKYSRSSSKKIAQRLLAPSVGTIEHIKPECKGGLSKPANYAHACKYDNTRRQHTDLTEFIKVNKKIPANVQKYFNRLIELLSSSDAEEFQLDKQYIRDIKKAFEEQSKGKLKIDISILDDTNF